MIAVERKADIRTLVTSKYHISVTKKNYVSLMIFVTYYSIIPSGYWINAIKRSLIDDGRNILEVKVKLEFEYGTFQHRHPKRNAKSPVTEIKRIHI